MRSDNATTREPQAGAVVTIPGDNCSPYTLTGGGWVDKYGGEDGNVYVSGLDVWASVLDHIATLAAEVERVKGETQGLTPTLTPEEGRAVIAEWRRGGGVDSARLTVALWNAFESGEICDIAKVREGVEKLNRYDEPPEADGGIYEFPDGDYLNRAEVLALLDATRGET